MTTRIRVAQRIRARLAGELRVHGLRAPAVARWDGGWQIDAQPNDRARVEGVAAAAGGLFALDLARRTWAGRLAEVRGRASVGHGLDTVDFDLFVRLLAFRERAEALFRDQDAPEQQRLEAFAAGINAWIDGGRWSDDPSWQRLDTRPRLFGAADVLLLSVGPILASRIPETLDADGPCADPVRARLALLRSEDLPGRPDVSAISAVPRSFAIDGAAVLRPEEVLPGGDDHRIQTDDRWVRLSVRRPDVAVRGADRVRPWLRTGPRGPLVSDLLASDGPATGSAWSLAWEGVGAPPRQEPATPPASTTLRLVPLEEGA